MRSRHPLRCPIPASQGPSGYALGRSFARSLTRQTARKAPSHPGCGKIGRSWRCAPWHRSPGYDLRRAPYDHPDFNSNALSEDLFSGSLNKPDRLVVFQDFLNIEPKLRLFCQKVFRHFLPKSF